MLKSTTGLNIFSTYSIYIMAFLNQDSRDRLINVVQAAVNSRCYKSAIDHMKQLVKEDQPLNFKEREILFSIYLSQKDPYYNYYQALSNANLNDKQRLDLREETKLMFYGITNEALELVNSCWIEKDENQKAILDYKYFKGLQHYWRYMVSQHNQQQKANERNKALKYFEEISRTPDDVLEAAHPTRLRAAAHEALLLQTASDKRIKAEDALNEGKKGLIHLTGELRDLAEIDLNRLQSDVESYSEQEKNETL